MQQRLREFARAVEFRGGVALHARAQALQAQVKRQHLLEGEPLLRGMRSRFERLNRRARRRAVHVGERLLKRRELKRREYFLRQPFRDVLEVAVERLLRELAQAQLMQPRGRGIDRRQMLVGFGRRAFPDELVLGMHDLKPHRAFARLAEELERPAAREILFLRGAEMKEPQDQMAGAVGHAHDEAAPAAVDDIGELHLRDDDGFLTRHETADGPQARAILVAERQVEQHVLNGVEPETRELVLELGTYSFKRGDRERGDVRLKCGVRNSECGIKSADSLFHLSFRIPHSPFRISDGASKPSSFPSWRP